MGATILSKQLEEFVNTAVSAVRDGHGQSVLDQLPVPAYTTDTEGNLTYWNRACVDFAGRDPQLGHDRWCVTWQLFTTSGERLLHEDCPMAETIKTRKQVRGKVAIAMRPDGSRRAFVPYPTPLFDEAEVFMGAVNLLVDVTLEQSVELAEQATRCSRLANATNDREASEILAGMARRYAETAATLKTA
jgi:PAS domain-containing protein